MDEQTTPTAVTNPDTHVEAEMRRLTRRSFTTGAIAALAGGSALAWLNSRAFDDGVRWPLRRALEFNERVAQALYRPTRLAPEFPIEQAVEPRVNGQIGLQTPLAPDNWKVRVVGQLDREIPLSAIRQLPAHSMTTELKCVEGWSRVVNWKGVRLADFLARFGAATDFVGLSTPQDVADVQGGDDRYYVGLDLASALHPQTLLCYEMNGQPLTAAHGAPLRLISTVKYGYKCIKRIGVIELADRRPADYWAQRGYDWYAGH